MRKKTQTLLSIALVLFAVDCSRQDRRSRQYEVVEEGSASGVTSAIAGPGEQLPPLTDTSTDTTTAFATLPTPPNIDPTLTTTDGSLADSLPNAPSSGGYGQRDPETYHPPRPAPPSRGTIEVTIPSRAAPETSPPTSTSTETAPPPPTTTDSTQPPPTGVEQMKDPPQEEEKEDDGEEDEEPPTAPPP
ncbi:MAG TPA: hypothetical protein VIL97_02600, partial [Thermoanaerobaculia bacterium]